MFPFLCTIQCILIKTFFIICLVGVAIKLFAKLTFGWCKSNAYLGGKTALITGGSTGIGYETALGLAARGCRVIIAHKNAIPNLKEDIIRKTGNSNIVVKLFDISSLKSVRELARDINENEERLDILINNAGVGGTLNCYTEDGLHKTMHINHFGGFLLTHLLIGLLKKSTPSRVVFVSSLAAYCENLTLENLNHHTASNVSHVEEGYIYANSKLCNIITSNILSQKLHGTGVTVNSLHPGVVHTNIAGNLFSGDSFLKKLIFNYVYKYLGKNSQEAAQTLLDAAVSKELEAVSGKFFVDCVSFWQPPKAKNEEFCMKVWKASEDYVKLNPEEKL